MTLFSLLLLWFFSYTIKDSRIRNISSSLHFLSTVPLSMLFTDTVTATVHKNRHGDGKTLTDIREFQLTKGSNKEFIPLSTRKNGYTDPIILPKGENKQVPLPTNNGGEESRSTSLRWLPTTDIIIHRQLQGNITLFDNVTLPIIHTIEVNRYEDNPCLALNQTRDNDICVLQAREINNWGTYPIDTQQPCLRAIAYQGSYATIVINGTNFFHNNNNLYENIDIKIISLLTNRSVPCNIIYAGSSSIASRTDILRCIIQKELPIGPLNVTIDFITSIESISINSLMFNITPYAVCPCGTYPTLDGECRHCPIGGSCRGIFDPPRALPDYWETISEEWINERHIDPIIYNVPMFVPCPYTGVCLGNQSCRSGSTGFMCTKCSPNFVRGSDGFCYECDTTQTNIGIAITIIIPLSLLFSWYLWLIYRNRCKQQYSSSNVLSHISIQTLPEINRRQSYPLSHLSSRTTSLSNSSPSASMRLQYRELRAFGSTTLVNIGLNFCQTLFALAIYVNLPRINTNAVNGDFLLIPKILMQFTVFGDFGISTLAYRCVNQVPYISRLKLFMVLPVALPHMIYMPYTIIYYGFSRSRLYKIAFPDAHKPKGQAIRDRAALLATFATVLIFPGTIATLARAQNCTSAMNGGYLIIDPEISCYDPQFKQLQLFAKFLGMFYICSIILLSYFLLRAGQWHSTIIKKCIAYNIQLDRTFGNPQLYRLSSKGALHANRLIRQIEHRSSIFDFSRRRKFTESFNAKIIDIYYFLHMDLVKSRGGIPYTWNCIALLRKVIFVGLATGFFGLYGSQTTLLSIIFLLGIEFVIQVRLLPYRSKIINLLESLALFGEFSIAISMTTRIGYISDSNSMDNNLNNRTNVPLTASGIPIKEQLFFDLAAILCTIPFIFLWLIVIMDNIFWQGKFLTLFHEWYERLFSDTENTTGIDSDVTIDSNGRFTRSSRNNNSNRLPNVQRSFIVNNPLASTPTLTENSLSTTEFHSINIPSTTTTTTTNTMVVTGSVENVVPPLPSAPPLLEPNYHSTHPIRHPNMTFYDNDDDIVHDPTNTIDLHQPSSIFVSHRSSLNNHHSHQDDNPTILAPYMDQRYHRRVRNTLPPPPRNNRGMQNSKSSSHIE